MTKHANETETNRCGTSNAPAESEAKAVPLGPVGLTPLSEAVRLEILNDSRNAIRKHVELWGDFDISKVILPDISVWLEDEPE